GLALEARVTEQIISFDNPNNNSLVFSNYVKLKNTVSATLQKRLAELVEANTPYTIKLVRNNSLIFKNGQGETIITPSLYKADKPITSDVTWRWSLDGNVTIGMTYTVKGADVTEQSVLTVAGYIGNDEVATTEIDVINVNDGADGAKGDKGETGNGIANTVITYGLSMSETTEPATWASNMPVLVKGMYLWTRTVQIYTNGKSTVSYQKGYIAKDGAQGLPGTPGKDAQTQYTHIAYADNATGGGFSLTDNTKDYWGMYQDFNAANSNDPTKYKWSKWKGDQGLPGKPGADGKTPYIHFAYADDNKGTNLSFTDKNQQYMGYYSDYTEANSTDYKKYTWVDRLANVQVGNKNLILKSNDFANPHKQNGANTTVTSTDEYFVIKSTGYTANAWGGMSWNMSISEMKAGEQFSILMPVYIDSSVNLDNGWDFVLKNHTSNSAAYYFDKPTNKKDQWVNVAITFKVFNDVVFDTYPFFVYLTRNGLMRIKPPMLVRGNVIPTDWSPAPEDIQSDIDSKADQTLTQQQLNALEAKRLQMETEMKALATLQQVSELETFINNLKQEDTDGRQKIIEITKAIEDRVKDIEPIMEYSQKLQFMDTYITQGNGGMVIGANDSSTKVVVTPDRISFQSGGSEVAYISQSMLHIDNGVFTMSLQLGHYITRAHPKNEYVNATYFVK
ncbi:hypothetical protein OQG70_08300, partial [Streptococcus macedonicus]|nr:hypothetical protein [Streptococcus macedonicus]